MVRVYLTCDTNYSCAGQQLSHTSPRTGEMSPSLSKDSTNTCPALPVPTGDMGPSDVSSGAPQVACANEEKN